MLNTNLVKVLLLVYINMTTNIITVNNINIMINIVVTVVNRDCDN